MIKKTVTTQNGKGFLNIEITRSYQTDYRYCAVTDFYDGLLDGHNEYGVGDTHDEAVQDLLEKLNF